MIAALADIVFLPKGEGGLLGELVSPSRSLLFHTEAGHGLGSVGIGVLISTPFGAPLTSGMNLIDARLDFWVDLAELYIAGPGQRFHLGYPTRVVARGAITSIFAPGDR